MRRTAPGCRVRLSTWRHRQMRCSGSCKRHPACGRALLTGQRADGRRRAPRSLQTMVGWCCGMAWSRSGGSGLQGAVGRQGSDARPFSQRSPGRPVPKSRSDPAARSSDILARRDLTTGIVAGDSHYIVASGEGGPGLPGHAHPQICFHALAIVDLGTGVFAGRWRSTTISKGGHDAGSSRHDRP
jgi:hypothetical protein